MLDFRGTISYAYSFFMTFRRDFTSLSKKIWFTKATLPWLERHKKSPARLLEDTTKANPYKTALIQAETGERWSFHEMNQYCNAVANYFISQTGLKKGDTVALICDNRIEYGPIWLGLNRVGLVPALINYRRTYKILKFWT